LSEVADAGASQIRGVVSLGRKISPPVADTVAEHIYGGRAIQATFNLASRSSFSSAVPVISVAWAAL
jgi:hypothetical protein